MLQSTTCRSIGSLVLVGMGKLTDMWLIGYREGIRRGQLEGRGVSEIWAGDCGDRLETANGQG